MKDLNDDEMVVISRVALEINEKGGGIFYKTMRDIVEIMYRCGLQLKYETKSIDSNNKILWTKTSVYRGIERRPVKLVITKAYN